MTSTAVEMDWSAYSEHYDLLCETNDSYTHLIQDFISFCKDKGFSRSSVIADVGAGTGNFLMSVANIFDQGALFHIDSNRDMNSIAMRKYDNLSTARPIVIESDCQQVDLPANSVDLIVCINALYAITPQEEVLLKFKDWLKPSGFLYVVDLGRKMDSSDWGAHFLKQAFKERRVFRYINDAIKAREVIRQNNITSLAQESGRYWQHGTIDFGQTLETSGFTVDKLETCYRGYADLAICRKPSAASISVK